MNNKQSYMLGVLSCAITVVIYMENFYNTTIIEKPTYIEVNIPTSKPDFNQEVKDINSSLNKSKLKHLLVYTWGLCEEYRVPYDIVKAVIQTESSWQHKAVSTSNAIGLMQIKPSTSMSEFKTPGSDLYDPYVNITVGIKYLSRLHDRFGDWNTALTAYSHGPTVTKTYSHNYINTNFYVSRVISKL